MKIFLDSADINELETALKLFPIDGFTTNPSLFRKAKMDYTSENIKLIRDFAAEHKLDVHFETSFEKSNEIFDEAMLMELQPHEAVKIPAGGEGFTAMNNLVEVKTNATLVFCLSQAVMAAKCNADFVSPFIGRIDDIGGDGIKLIRQISAVYQKFEITTEIISASIRSVRHVNQSLLAGAHIVTVPLNILEALTKNSMMLDGVKKFNEDSKK